MRTTIRLKGMDGPIEFHMELDAGFTGHRWLLKALEQNLCYEPDVTWVMIRALRQGDVAIDVGANAGFFTLLMSQIVGMMGKVVAFEPGQNNLGRLSQEIFDNSHRNILFNRVALSDEDGYCQFFENVDNTGGNAMWNPGLYPDNEQTRLRPTVYEVETCKLDTIYRILTPRLIKIDVEGAEEKVLRGAEQMLKRKPPFVVCEIHDFGLRQMGSTPAAVFDYMKSFGYQAYFLSTYGDFPAFIPEGLNIDLSAPRNFLFSTEEYVVGAWNREFKNDGA